MTCLNYPCFICLQNQERAELKGTYALQKLFGDKGEWIEFLGTSIKLPKEVTDTLTDEEIDEMISRMAEWN